MAQITFGGKGCWKKFAKGDFLVFLQHVNSEESIVLAPRRKREGAGVFVVGLSSLPYYFDSKRGMPTEYGIKTIIAGMKVMGLDPNDRFAIRGVIDCLYEYAPDLVQMPPDLDGPAAPKWLEAVDVLVNGELVNTHEVAH